MKAASWAIRCCTPMARFSIIRICSPAAWWATAKRKPDPAPPAGIPTNFSIPVRDGAVLPILHLNGYKIAGPTVLARIPHDELESLFEGYGYQAAGSWKGDDPDTMHQLMAETLDEVDR